MFRVALTGAILIVKDAFGESIMPDEELPVIAKFEVRRRAYLAPDGAILRDLPNFAADQNLIVSMYRGMALARTFDLRAVSLQRTGRLGTYATSLGQEAVAVGIASAMRPEDVLLPSYRDKPHGSVVVTTERAAVFAAIWKEVSGMLGLTGHFDAGPRWH